MRISDWSSDVCSSDLDVQRGDTGGDSMISGGEGKALFIYNSLFNTIENNHFEKSSLGIHLTAGSEDNRIAGNAFVGNQQQVKYVATSTPEWSVDGRGKYWSDRSEERRVGKEVVSTGRTRWEPDR